MPTTPSFFTRPPWPSQSMTTCASSTHWPNSGRPIQRACSALLWSGAPAMAVSLGFVSPVARRSGIATSQPARINSFATGCVTAAALPSISISRHGDPFDITS